jgi:hypothetical protein
MSGRQCGRLVRAFTRASWRGRCSTCYCTCCTIETDSARPLGESCRLVFFLTLRRGVDPSRRRSPASSSAATVGTMRCTSLRSRRWHATGPEDREPTVDYQSGRLCECARPLPNSSVLEKYCRRMAKGLTGITPLLQRHNSVYWFGTCPKRLAAQIASPYSLQTAKAAAAPPCVVAVGRHVAT